MKIDETAKRSIRVPHMAVVRAPDLLPMRYTTNEMAESLGCSPRTLRDWAKIGLPFEMDIKNHLWFIGTDVRDWVNKMRQDRLKRYNGAALDTKMAYCMKCHDRVEIMNPSILSIGKHSRLKGSCPRCGSIVYRGIKHG